ncbi:hypothetical protein Ancab_012164 [Ancistrocladus abbreviatus]
MTDEPLLTIASLEFLIPIASMEDPVNSMQHQMDVNALSSTRCLDGNDSEKEAPPNETSKGFNVIDLMKSKVEEVGRLFYPLLPCRRDSALSFPELAAYEIPSPRMSYQESGSPFHQEDFAIAMMKLSNLSVLTMPMGQIHLQLCHGKAMKI